MLRLLHVTTALTVLAACSAPSTGPSEPQALEPFFGAAAREQSSIITCVATVTTSGHSVTVAWARVKVGSVSVITEDGTITTALERARRRGSVSFTPSSAPLGFRLQNGEVTVAQGACAAP